GRYAWTGGRPRIILRSRGRDIQSRRGDRGEMRTADPLDVLREIVREQPPTRSRGYPAAPAPFSSGAVGYLAYDVVRQFEKLPDNNPDDLHLPDSYFLAPDEIVVFDHRTGQAFVCLYSEAAREQRLNEIVETLTLTPDPSPMK